ncbi:tRNA lysidine(34) synthetase TilS [Xanthobacter sp. DSM 24535]|uniref:tRNA lysidine(34) synthetase TilS n=1 Tax=Roseixanthobacter psychrophilus TaxID=3119917 RepID=UPI0037264FD4
MPAAEAAPVAPRPIEDSELPALFSLFAGHSSVLIACSGGPDSTALMLLAARWAALCAGAPMLHVATVDHGLRPEAAQEAQGVAGHARALGLPHAILSWHGPHPKSGIQEAARDARYALLAARAREIGGTAIVTAHTQDDQAETIVMRLARGSGLAGLAGMAPRSRRHGLAVLRPFLTVPKARLVATLEAGGIGFVRDPSNSDAKFTRVRLRALMPVLAGEGLDAEGLARLARRLARAEAALEQAADAAFAVLAPPGAPRAPVRVARATFFALPEEIALRVLHRAIDVVGDEGPVELAKLERLLGRLLGAEAEGHSICGTLAGARVHLAGGHLEVARALPRRPRKPGNSA